MKQLNDQNNLIFKYVHLRFVFVNFMHISGELTVGRARKTQI